MTYAINDFIKGTKAVSDDANGAFGRLSGDQLNWKPATDSWSIAQCLDHLIKTNKGFDEILSELATGTRKRSFMEKWSPFSGLLGNMLMKSIKNDKKKYKTPSDDIVPPSDLGENIVEQFSAHQNEFAEKVKPLENLEWDRIVITSPFIKMITYRLDTALEFAVEHEWRHLRQAKRVMEAEGFPA